MDSIEDTIESDETRVGIEEALVMKRAFLSWLADFVALGMQPGSSFHRLSLCLELMRVIKSVEDFKIDSTFQSCIHDEPPLLENELCSRALVANLLFDTFEPNRVAASGLLKSFSGRLPILLNESGERDELLRRGVNLVSAKFSLSVLVFDNR